ncbi:MAG: winged helix-turn-helix domain-containing protein [Thermosynechococcaceae cyanobacterium]
MTQLPKTYRADILKLQPMGRPKVVTEDYLAALATLLRRSPRDYGYPFKRWTAGWLGRHLAKEFDIDVSDRHINRLLKEMGLSTRHSVPEATIDLMAPSVQGSHIQIRDLNPSQLSDLDCLPL